MFRDLMGLTGFRFPKMRDPVVGVPMISGQVF